VLDASGKYVFPGGIDVHTHLDMPFGGTTSADDFETGTRAAAFGGTTTLIDFAIQYKGQPLRKAFDTWMDKASKKAVCDYAFHCIVTDIGNGQLQEMNALVGEGVTSFKLFMAYPGVFMLDDASIFRALADHRKERRAHLHACRKWKRDRRHRAAGPGRREDGAEVSRSYSAHHGGG
jgi:dihydropyrimidinase